MSVKYLMEFTICLWLGSVPAYFSQIIRSSIPQHLIAGSKELTITKTKGTVIIWSKQSTCLRELKSHVI